MRDDNKSSARTLGEGIEKLRRIDRRARNVGDGYEKGNERV